MTFGEWQQLAPEAAAREVRRRAEACLARRPAPRRAGGAPGRAGPRGRLCRRPRPAARCAASPTCSRTSSTSAGLPTLAGSSFLAEVRPAPAEDSQCVRELRAAGAVLAGKTHLFEFAWGLTGENAHYGDCEHPRFPGRTSGGSSSGSAAAVAAGVVPLRSAPTPAARSACRRRSAGSSATGACRAARGSPGPSRSPRASTRRAGSPGPLRTCARRSPRLSGSARSGGAPRGCYLDMPGLDPDVAAACARGGGGPGAARGRGGPRRAPAEVRPSGRDLRRARGIETWKIHRKWADRYRERYGPLRPGPPRPRARDLAGPGGGGGAEPGRAQALLGEVLPGLRLPGHGGRAVPGAGQGATARRPAGCACSASPRRRASPACPRSRYRSRCPRGCPRAFRLSQGTRRARCSPGRWARGAGQPSDWFRKMRLMPMNAKSRNAAPWPFQVLDCHIRNHSPPTVMNTKYHWKRPAVRPTDARTLASLQSAAGAPRALQSRSAPAPIRAQQRASQPIIDA